MSTASPITACAWTPTPTMLPQFPPKASLKDSGDGAATMLARRIAAAACAGPYRTVAAPIKGDALIVKRSRFVAHVVGGLRSGDDGAADAMEWVRETSDPGASHNCFAFRVGGDRERASDDGEPSGTAGMPILSQIRAAGLDRVAVLVVREYGGTKLGVGGLVRAYGQAARQVLERAAVIEVGPPPITFRALVPYADYGAVMALVSSFPPADGIRLLREEHASDPDAAALVLEAEAARADDLADAVARVTQGRARVDVGKPQDARP